MKHSKLGASNFTRWSNCPGSVELSQGIESVSSAYADEGNRAHEMGANVLLGREQPAFDNEMWEHVKVYVDTVSQDKNDEIQVEVRFDLSRIWPGCFGTADCVGFCKRENLLRVYDFKYGAGIFVSVDSDQLRYYALGALLQTGFGAERIEMVIVQPRCPGEEGPVRRLRFHAFDILDFAIKLKKAAERTEEQNAPLVGGEWCRFCPAAGICPELGRQANEIARSEFNAVSGYDVRRLAETLSKLDQIESFAASVRSFAYAEALKGIEIPGFKLVEKVARRKWANEQEAAIAAAQIVNEDPSLKLFTEPELISPPQVEKLLGKEVYKNVFQKHVALESSGTTLVPVTDKRPAFSRRPELEFAPITNEEKG